MRPVTLSALACFAVLAFAPAAPAQDVRAEAGLELARAWCSNCHLVEPGGSASDAAPAFETVANDPAKTEDGLRTWLADPHPPMPNLSLSEQEIDSIIAYLNSLKRQ